MFLRNERSALKGLLPELHTALESTPTRELETEGGPAIKLFKSTGAGRLLAPEASGGLGATALEATRIQRAIGYRSPSVAIASTMHHFSLASLMEAARDGDGMHLLLVDAIGSQNLLLASGFAEGKTGASVLSPSLTAEKVDDGYVLNGAKRPCSLSRSMDMLTASVAVEGEDGPELAVAAIPATAEGIRVEPFWGAPVLRAAESEAVLLENVMISDGQLVRVGRPGEAAVDRVQQAGFLWFELLMTASYLGIVSGLLARVLDGQRGDPTARVHLVAAIESSAAALESIAMRLDTQGPSEDLLTRVLLCRYSAQRVIGTVVNECVELLGGMAFISGDSDVHLYAEASRCLAFHPPGLQRAAPALVESLTGGAFHTV